jgi:pimeloyl-ACP methyl ester carboxylesterase
MDHPTDTTAGTDTAAGTITANGLEFSYLESGPPDGPLALCLHGFPDSAHTWRYLLPELGRAGYHAVAPFQRGYAPTAIPDDGHYQIGALARDANSLHEVLGGASDAVIIGHDWGALATYAAVAHQPARWRRAVTAAVAPTAAVMASFFTFGQLQRSWYTFFFQSPLAEIALPLDDFVFIDRLWADWSPGYDAAFDLARVKESIGDPEHIAAAIGYYRALYNSDLHDPGLADEQAAGNLPMPIPTLYLHGRDDGCFALNAVGNPLDFLAEGSEMVVVDDAGHFLHVEQPEVVNRHILEFLAP